MIAIDTILILFILQASTTIISGHVVAYNSYASRRLGRTLLTYRWLMFCLIAAGPNAKLAEPWKVFTASCGIRLVLSLTILQGCQSRIMIIWPLLPGKVPIHSVVL